MNKYMLTLSALLTAFFITFAWAKPLMEEEPESKLLSNQISISGKVIECGIRCWRLEPTAPTRKQLSSLIKKPYTIGVSAEDFEFNRYWKGKTITVKGKLIQFIGKDKASELLIFPVELKEVTGAPKETEKFKSYSAGKKTVLSGELIVRKEYDRQLEGVSDQYYLKLYEPITIGNYTANSSRKLNGVELMQIEAESIEKSCFNKKVKAKGWLSLAEYAWRQHTRIIFETDMKDIEVLSK
jgi:hypothetical protein